MFWILSLKVRVLLCEPQRSESHRGKIKISNKKFQNMNGSEAKKGTEDNVT